MFISPEYNNNNILIATSIKISDDEERDKKLFFNSTRVSTNNLIYMNQTHSSNIAIIDEKNKNIYSYREQKAIDDTDAIITNIANTPLLVRTADCLPIVVYSKDKKAIAVVHAGWRGVVSKIIPKTIELMMNTYFISPSDAYIYMGARISIDDYEVGIDVAKLFTQKKFEKNSWYVDIGAEAKEQLLSMGIKEQNIEDSKLSTFNDNRLYSYRRDKNKSGRIFTLAMITK